MFKPVSPKTDFPALERELLEKWYKSGIVRTYLEKNKNSPKRFSFLDGPITANNPMGVHHAWGRTYKDFWQRFYNMRGFKQRFQNGFDEQGLWVEVEVEKELGLKNKKDIENLVSGNKFKSLEKFISLCKERVKKFSSIQTEQSKRLGYFMDWDNSYHTSSDENNYAIWNFIKVVYERGWLYKGRDSVPWCPRCGTAISEHEILTEEYKNLTHKTIVFKLKIKGRENEFLLAWTTTPWTIPGNVALAVDPDLSYWKMKNDEGENIIIINPTASGDREKKDMFVNRLGLTNGWVKTQELKGKDLVGIEYEAPYDDLSPVQKTLRGYTHRVVAADPQILKIDPAEGTGIVHVAPGAGTEDHRLGIKEKLPVIEEIDEMGVFISGFGFVSGLSTKDASRAILEDLEDRNLAYCILDYTHRYPTCWRCKTELVWRVVDEWYIAMDSPSHKALDGKHTYREQMIEVAKKINWLPEWGLDRELDWLENMHDWLISKKRYWGLALPIWECKKCGSFEVIGGKEELKERVVEGWDAFNGHSPHRPWIDQIKITCTKCFTVVSRIPDVGNPWLDAGIVAFSTMPSSVWFPADFITESFPGQFKNWFYSLIAMSTALKNTNPFKTVLAFGSVRDEKGEEMHKSKGNAIEFNEAADKIGVDVMRWLYLRTNPEHNVNFGHHIADEIRRFFHLRLWNVYAFFVMYANVDGWNPVGSEKSEVRSRNVLDRWILSQLHQSIKTITEYIEEYNAYKAVEVAEDFVINDLSTWYVRRIRDRVGPAAPDGKDKDDAYHTLWIVLTEFSKVLAPFTPFISDEIYTNLTGEKSVHLADWPTWNENLMDKNLEAEMDKARKVVEVVHATRKFHGIKVRQPLEGFSYSIPKRLSKGIEKLMAGETNVKNVRFDELESRFDAPIVSLNKELTRELISEGEAREIVRRIQEERKKLGTSLNEKVNVFIENFPNNYEKYIKNEALVDNLTVSKHFRVEKSHA